VPATGPPPRQRGVLQRDNPFDRAEVTFAERVALRAKKSLPSMAWRSWCRRRSRNPHNGHLFAFRCRRGGLIKVLWHDGQGMCLFAKRLERSRFVWPSTVTREGIDRISTTGQINFCVPEPILRPSVVIEGQTLGSGL
jgi:IS66 Orf2 like protein